MPVVAGYRAAVPGLAPTGPRADEATAVLLAFAVHWNAFGHGWDARLVTEALVCVQARRACWRVGLGAMIVEVML